MSRLVAMLGMTLGLSGCAGVVMAPPPGQEYLFPALLYQRNDGLVVAVFEVPRRHSYALGCEDLAKIWNAPAQKVPSADWGTLEPTLNIVADLHCNGQTQKVVTAESDRPDAVLVKHRNGTTCRHYVDHPQWFKVFAGEPKTQLEPVLAIEVPSRGIDFRSSLRFEPKIGDLDPKCL